MPKEIISGNLEEATMSTNLKSVDSKPDILSLLTPMETSSSTAFSSIWLDIRVAVSLSGLNIFLPKFVPKKTANIKGNRIVYSSK